MLGCQTVTVRQGGVDNLNNPITPTTFDVDNCLVSPASTAEQLEIDRTGGTTSVEVFIPLTTGIDHTCDLQINNRWYRVVGDPEPYVDEDPELSGYQVTATRSQGA
jgi:hypothetical protein